MNIFLKQKVTETNTHRVGPKQNICKCIFPFLSILKVADNITLNLLGIFQIIESYAFVY